MADQISRIRSIQVTPSNARLSNALPLNVATGAIATQQTSVRYPAMIAAKSKSEQDDLEFEFPFPPQQVSYADLAPEIAQIERAGKTPIVAFTRYKARQVTLQFLLAVPFDGLQMDIEADIATLQFIASSGRPVWFYNFDRFLGNPIGRSTTDATTFFWSITDLNFDSIRRNSAQRIVQADMTMTIIENNNPNIVVADLPAISYTEEVKEQNPSSSGNKPKEQDFMEYTETWETFGKPRI